MHAAFGKIRIESTSTLGIKGGNGPKGWDVRRHPADPKSGKEKLRQRITRQKEKARRGPGGQMKEESGCLQTKKKITRQIGDGRTTAKKKKKIDGGVLQLQSQKLFKKSTGQCEGPTCTPLAEIKGMRGCAHTRNLGSQRHPPQGVEDRAQVTTEPNSESDQALADTERCRGSATKAASKRTNESKKRGHAKAGSSSGLRRSCERKRWN